MNNLLTRKKHSKRIAKMVLQAGIIKKPFFDNLYIAAYKIQRKPKRKHNTTYRFHRYYKELYFSEIDYWGECDEISLIDHVSEGLYYRFNNIDYNGNIEQPEIRFDTTLKIIKKLKQMIKHESAIKRLSILQTLNQNI